MKQSLICILLMLTLVTSAEYPAFSKAFWEGERELAQGKITRGAALGVTGAVLIWPTAVMISRARENPHKYVPLSVLFGTASLGAMGHGFASIGSGKRELATAERWINEYAHHPHSVDRNEEQSDWLSYQEKSAAKITVFGAYTVSIAGMMITNGIIQSARSDGEIEGDDISVWPYFAVGGALLPMGISSIVKSRKRSDELSELRIASVASRSQFIPFAAPAPGEMIFGAVYTLRF